MAHDGARRRRPKLSIWFASAAVLGLAATAAAVPVKGRLVVPEGFAGPEEGAAGERTWRVWNGFLEPVARSVDLPREVTVVLTGGGASAPIGCEHRLSGGDFLPRTLVVREGQPLRVLNADGIVYELRSSDLPGFAEATTAPGNALSAPVPSGGPYTLVDRNLPHVRGLVVALPELAACATVARDGALTFGDVPPGRYTLRVFRDGREIAHRELSLEDERGHGELLLDPLPLPLPHPSPLPQPLPAQGTE